ncbi:hypothetical protein GCM10010191_48280 [Actinomadura vinacea]|uniref:Bacterial bifunctional deaminase-reductase C-terminal domain-containing protein n=1 Tax=Actinomadura vinacea TaxID=115336 RepID=A0ABN3JG54_9ACTN
MEVDVGLEVDDPAGFVQELKRQDGQDIWLCGGGNLAAHLLGEIDDLVLKRNPIVLGDGIRLFDGPFAAHRFALTDARPFPSGVTVMRYAKNP